MESTSSSVVCCFTCKYGNTWNFNLLFLVKCMATTRAQLPLGMIVVAGMLFLHNMSLVLWLIFQWRQYFSHEIFPYMLGVGIAELSRID